MRVMTRPSWEQRIARAGELADIFPFAAEVLKFYAGVARFQKALYGYIQQARGRTPLAGQLFLQCLDTVLLLPRFPSFLKTVQQLGPMPLAEKAEEIAAAGEMRWEQLLRNFWHHSESAEPSYAEAFFPRAFLQPYAEYVAERLPDPMRRGNNATCPYCESEPVVGVMREEQLGAKRGFICSLCAHEWEFPRVMCPGCGEDRNDALCVYTSEFFEHVRVDACDTCKTYVKTVDLTKNGLAIPVVDEIASLPLTLWAEENGYSKLQPNLMAV